MTDHQNNYDKNRNYKQKKHSVQNKNSSYPSRNNNPPNMFGGFFNGNLVSDMKFGGKDHELSGFLQREIYIRDRYGNIQRAREKQFFNSGNSKHIHVGGDYRY